MIDFYESIKKGKRGELIFKEDFLDFLDIKYEDVTNSQRFQIVDTDYLTKVGMYEVKNSYKDNEKLIFEDYTNINTSLAPKSLGWIYKTKADLIVFVSDKTRTMIFLPFNDRFKAHYKHIREKTTLRKNRVSHGNGRKWQSAYRVVPFSMLEGYISIYKVRQKE